MTAATGDPQSKQQADILVLLAHWYSDEEAAAVVALVKQAADAAAKPYRELVGKVAHHLQTTHPTSAEGWTFTAMPTVLAALIREAARDE